jgi:putative membrane protein
LSGTLILVALGLYPTIIAAIAHFQLDILAAFGAGGILGLLLFSRLLSWLMRMHQTALMATMCGFLIGSLKLVWPWRYRPEFADEPSLPVGMINLLPKQYAELAQIDPATTECLVFALLGLLLVAGFDYVSRRSEG